MAVFKSRWYSIACKEAGHAEIDLLDEIGFFGTSAEQFVQDLRACGPVSTIKLNIDCPGGSCNDGFTIYDALRATRARVEVNVIGLAASMASVIMLAGDKRRIAENGRVMIRRVTAGAGGNADELDAAAKIARQFEDRVVGIYVRATGKPEAEIRDLMKAQMGTWFFGQDAVDAGFADEVIPGVKARAFQPQWAGLFTMLPAALFDTRSAAMDTTPSPAPLSEKPATAETPAGEEPPAAAPVEPPAPAAAPDEPPADPVEPPAAPENKGSFISRAIAALSGDTALREENAQLKATAAALTTERDAALARAVDFEAIRAERDALKADRAEMEALIAKAEADQKTIGRAAAELAASHGLKPEAQAVLPPPHGEETGTKTMTRAEFDALPHPARNEFMRSGGKLTD